MLNRRKGIRGHRAAALTSAMLKWYRHMYNSAYGKREPEEWKQSHVGGVDGISCQHFQAMITQLRQKHWEWHEDKRRDVWHGIEKTPAMYTASMDNKAAFDVARPRHSATMLGEQDTHGWRDELFAPDGVRERTSNIRTCREQRRHHEVHPSRKRRSAKAHPME